jgi:cytochrome b subunit of formate dehydrogenase
MIIVAIGGMLAHNLVIWRSKAVVRCQHEHRVVTRMTPDQRWQHVLLLASFFTLVGTGFALKYPDSWFALLLGMRERVRSVTHRVAGVVLIGLGVYHLVCATLTRDGRRLVKDFPPVTKDVSDAWGTMLYYLGLRKEKPEFARFTYAEKAEYWALVWGLIVMASTGLMLWAKVSVGSAVAAGGSMSPPRSTSMKPFCLRWRLWSGISTRCSLIPIFTNELDVVGWQDVLRALSRGTRTRYVDAPESSGSRAKFPWGRGERVRRFIDRDIPKPGVLRFPAPGGMHEGT